LSHYVQKKGQKNAQKLKVEFKLTSGQTEDKSILVFLTKKEVCGESIHVNKKAAAARKDTILARLMSKHMSHDAFNASDCGLF
jgi:hypothetical protein